MKAAQAKQQVIEAQAYADAMTIRSKAEAEANQRIAASLTPALIEKMRIEKLNPQVKMVVPSDSRLIMGLDKL
jgi:regulator of protease activity HflC (stomatin/prohibitin superfamily)